MNYSMGLLFSELHKIIYESIRAAMEGKVRQPKEIWEAFHLFEYAKTVRPPEKDEMARNRLDAIFVKRGFDSGFAHLQNRTRDGFTMRNADYIFTILAEFQDIPVLVCFLRFLEFCRDTSRPLSVFNDKKTISMTLDEVIVNIKKHIETELKKLENTSNDNDEAATPSAIQPRLTVKQAKANDLNYYANATLKVIGREKEQKRLTDFLHCDLNVAWFQLAGVAGQGKSRLAFELVNHAKNLGWNAGLLEENDIRFFDVQWQTWQPDRPYLIVFDYVVGREEKIKPILQTLAYRQGEFLHNIRILLVERQRWNKGISFNASVPRRSDGAGFQLSSAAESNAEWFLSLCQDNNYDGHDHTLSNSRFDNGAVELEKLNEDDLVTLVRQIAKHVSDKELAISDYGIKETLLHIDKSGRPLYAYFLGQELGYGATATGWSNYDLLNAALSRERAKWWAAAFGGKPPLLEDDTPASRLAVLATMTDGINCREAHKNSLIPKANAELRRQALALTGGSLANKSDSPLQDIPSMQPDLLGEWFVIANFDADGPPLEEITVAAWSYASEKMSAFMQRLYQDFPNHPIVNKMLHCLDLDEINTNVLSKVANALFLCLKTAKLMVHENVIRALHINADNGDPQSMFILGVCYSTGADVAKDLHKAVAYYKKSAEAGDTKAIVNLGRCYQYGIGVVQNVEQAFAHYQRAADAEGDTTAITNLGACYELGEGVAQDVDKAIEYYKKAAEAGNTIAMTNLGECYEKGIGVTPDIGEAVAYFEKAAEAGSTTAMVRLGYYHYHGIYVARDVNNAVTYYEKAAEAGNTTAMANLGVLYENGIDVAQDVDKAVAYYRKAAEEGNTTVMVNLGFYYQNGISVAQDTDKAVAYYKKAEEAGDTTAMVNLGYCYHQGIGVAQDTKKAIAYYEKAAEAGNPSAMFTLGICYRDGIGVTQDEDKAIAYYEKAAEAGNTIAMANLGYCYQYGIGVVQDEVKAVAYYKKAAEAGDTKAMVNLGICYQDGIGVIQDEDKAIAYYENAAEAGDTTVMFNLGYCYEHGIGVAQDANKAVTCYENAAESGVTKAMVNLGICYRDGIGVVRDVDKAVAYFEKAAEAGSTSAMFCLGMLYEYGTNVIQDEVKAVVYYKKAAEAGDIRAMVNLGYCYENQIGVALDKQKAVEYYEKAAKAGNAIAMSNLGNCYFYGIGVAKDMNKAATYYEKAAEAGNMTKN